MSVRPPAVAGMFYEAGRERLERDVGKYLDAGGEEPRPAFGAIVPHAGYIYSGPVAGAVYARLRVPAVANIMQRDGYIPDDRDPTAAAAFFRKEVTQAAEAVKAAGIEPN